MTSFFIFACLLLMTVAGFPEKGFHQGLSRSSVEADARISGGVDIDIREVPYIVALETKGNKAQQFCAGALITDSHVLTAAQCLAKPAEKLRIRAGSHKRNSGGTLYGIAKYVKHPLFNSNNFDYDVGIIHLEDKVKLGDTVKTIKVSDVAPKVGTRVRIAGWGMKEEDGELSPVLQKADPPVMEWETCFDIFKKFLVTITQRMMCTHGNGTDACVGDGGGPAVLNGVVTGIMSWGIGCGRPMFPSVQTNVTDPKIRAFIREQANV